MPEYSYICREHDEPYIFDVKRSIEQEIDVHVACPRPGCNHLAKRYFPGEKFSGRVRGGYGGGPITK